MNNKQRKSVHQIPDPGSTHVFQNGTRETKDNVNNQPFGALQHSAQPLIMLE